MIIFQALYFALPMYLANMAPVIVKGFPLFAGPIDGGRHWNKKPILGKNKTWRGLIAGTLMGAAVISVQSTLAQSFPFFQELSLMDFTQGSALFFGLLAGFGALFGDAAKSFFKRRFGIPAGQPWIPFDQLDFIAGGLLFTWFIYMPPFNAFLVLLFFTPFLHWGVNVLSYRLGLKDVPW
jgi:CDP-2,3-bis-(O-geranylgeranyl)-sn-glycerol synthase